MKQQRPMPGDVVELTGTHSIAEAGEWGVIGGEVGDKLKQIHITFNPNVFRGKSNRHSTGPEFVSCSGGPGAMFLSYRRLTPTGRTRKINCWRWKDYPRADGGEHYEIEVPVWEWDGQYTATANPPTEVKS